MTKKTKNKGGRPTDYKKEYNEQAEKVCVIFGADDKKLAEFFGVCVATIDNWKKEYPEFLESIKKGKDKYDTENVEVSLRERACGYKHKETKYFSHEGVVTDKRILTKHYPPDTTAAIFWLKNRHPERWKDIKAVELTGKDGGPIRTQDIKIDLSDFTDEELAVIEKMSIKIKEDKCNNQQ